MYTKKNEKREGEGKRKREKRKERWKKRDEKKKETTCCIFYFSFCFLTWRTHTFMSRLSFIRLGSGKKTATYVTPSQHLYCTLLLFMAICNCVFLVWCASIGVNCVSMLLRCFGCAKKLFSRSMSSTHVERTADSSRDDVSRFPCPRKLLYDGLCRYLLGFLWKLCISSPPLSKASLWKWLTKG